MSRIWDALQKIEKQRDDVTQSHSGDFDLDKVRLTPKQRVAIHALLRTSTIEEAAGAAGVTEKSLRRWLGQPGFVAAYYAAGRDEIDSMMEKLDTATQKALAVLEQAGELLRTIGMPAEEAENGEANGQERGQPEFRDE